MRTLEAIETDIFNIQRKIKNVKALGYSAKIFQDQLMRLENELVTYEYVTAILTGSDKGIQQQNKQKKLAYLGILESFMNDNSENKRDRMLSAINALKINSEDKPNAWSSYALEDRVKEVKARKLALDNKV